VSGDASGLAQQRRVRRGWVAIGVLAIVLSALGSASLFRALGPSQEYLAVARDVPVGAQLTRADLRTVRLPGTPGLSPVPAGQADRVLEMYAAVPLAGGTLVSLSQLTDVRVPGPGEQLVAIPLGRDQLPGGMLRPGDQLLLVATTGGPAASRADESPRTFVARVHDVWEGAGRGNSLVVSVLVADRDGVPVAGLAAAGRVAVVLVPEVRP
jgi:hypothetical protein